VSDRGRKRGKGVLRENCLQCWTETHLLEMLGGLDLQKRGKCSLGEGRKKEKEEKMDGMSEKGELGGGGRNSTGKNGNKPSQRG